MALVSTPESINTFTAMHCLQFYLTPFQRHSPAWQARRQSFAGGHNQCMPELPAVAPWKVVQVQSDLGVAALSFAQDTAPHSLACGHKGRLQEGKKPLSKRISNNFIKHNFLSVSLIWFCKLEIQAFADPTYLASCWEMLHWITVQIWICFQRTEVFPIVARNLGI